MVLMHKERYKNSCKNTKLNFFRKTLAYCECMRYTITNGTSRNTPPRNGEICGNSKKGRLHRYQRTQPPRAVKKGKAMTSKSNNNNAMNSIAKNGEKIKNFETLKRNYEAALASGKDSGGELMDLSTAIAYSVINKCIDPQRKTAVDRETVSDNGNNPAMLKVKQGIARDIATLENTRRNANAATRTTYNADGDLITETVDKTAETALASLISETLTDGIDLVQTAALAILEQAAEHADSGTEWLDRRYIVNRLSRRVYIQAADSAAYTETETSPIQEIYRAVRRHVQESRAVQTDPRNGYTYIEDYTQDGLDEIYIRMGKYVDIGGYDSNGNYTAGIESAHTYESILAKLNLTARQATIIHLRMQGYGYKAIGTYLGVTHESIRKQLVRIAEKAAAIGFMPNGYEPKQPPKPPKPITTVIQIDENGKEIARFETMRAAETATGIDHRGIGAAIKGIKQKTAGGYKWRLESAED